MTKIAAIATKLFAQMTIRVESLGHPVEASPRLASVSCARVVPPK
jgi:hypothetical protein